MFEARDADLAPTPLGQLWRSRFLQPAPDTDETVLMELLVRYGVPQSLVDQAVGAITETAI